MQKFSFSITNSYNTLNNIAVLNNLIATEITTPLISTNPYGDAIEITFDGILNNEDSVKLYNIVTGWDSNIITKYDKVINTSLSSINGIINTSYKRFGVYGYDGITTVGRIKKITIVGYKDNGVTNYSVRVFDVTNSKTIVETIFNNDVEDMLDMGMIENIPNDSAIIEIQIKKNGGTNSQKVYVSNITFFV